MLVPGGVSLMVLNGLNNCCSVTGLNFGTRSHSCALWGLLEQRGWGMCPAKIIAGSTVLTISQVRIIVETRPHPPEIIFIKTTKRLSEKPHLWPADSHSWVPSRSTNSTYTSQQEPGTALGVWNVTAKQMKRNTCPWHSKLL